MHRHPEHHHLEFWGEVEGEEEAEEGGGEKRGGKEKRTLSQLQKIHFPLLVLYKGFARQGFCVFRGGSRGDPRRVKVWRN